MNQLDELEAAHMWHIASLGNRPERIVAENRLVDLLIASSGALLAVARAAAWVRKAYELDEDDNDFAAEFCAALDKLETDQ